MGQVEFPVAGVVLVHLGLAVAAYVVAEEVAGVAHLTIPTHGEPLAIGVGHHAVTGVHLREDGHRGETYHYAQCCSLDSIHFFSLFVRFTFSVCQVLFPSGWQMQSYIVAMGCTILKNW